MSSAAVAGIVVAVVLLVAAAVAGGVFYYRRRSCTAVPQSVSITYSCFNKIYEIYCAKNITGTVV